MGWLGNKEAEPIIMHEKSLAETMKLLPSRSVTCIQLNKETELWEVWYKSVLFAELKELKDAHDRLQKLIALDTTK